MRFLFFKISKSTIDNEPSLFCLYHVHSIKRKQPILCTSTKPLERTTHWLGSEECFKVEEITVTRSQATYIAYLSWCWHFILSLAVNLGRGR